MYEALGQAYAQGEGEVGMVKKLVAAIDGKSYRGISLASQMIHGSRSYVEFNCRDKPVTKELGDMLVISLVSAGGERLFQRISIIQNKKDSSGKWGIDLEQLYLLKNFPLFTGNKGMFRNCRDIAFRNESGCLGSYGLFQTPGEMIVASAPLVTELLKGKKTLSPSDIQVLQVMPSSQSGGLLNNSVPWWPRPFLRHPEESFHFFEKIIRRYGVIPFGGFNGFLGNVHFCRDICDFTRAWTHLSLGEPTYAWDQVVNPDVDAFSVFILRQYGFDHLPKLPSDNVFGDREFEGTLAVFLMHLDVERDE